MLTVTDSVASDTSLTGIFLAVNQHLERSNVSTIGFWFYAWLVVLRSLYVVG